VEWFEKFEDDLPSGTVRIRMDVGDDGVREIHISGMDL
jgi:tRNA A37 threonylcarbamoyladenosine biosynthesis protein TsaE